MEYNPAASLLYRYVVDNVIQSLEDKIPGHVLRNLELSWLKFLEEADTVEDINQWSNVSDGHKRNQEDAQFQHELRLKDQQYKLLCANTSGTAKDFHPAREKVSRGQLSGPAYFGPYASLLVSTIAELDSAGEKPSDSTTVVDKTPSSKRPKNSESKKPATAVNIPQLDGLDDDNSVDRIHEREDREESSDSDLEEFVRQKARKDKDSYQHLDVSEENMKNSRIESNMDTVDIDDISQNLIVGTVSPLTTIDKKGIHYSTTLETSIVRLNGRDYFARNLQLNLKLSV
mmetsp:Transcript_9273/g.12105  ORF Transcript_9273/g.12105 Transcript_9273/m.12105 type:complete len:287 (-) Transcript_9273:71-931(-)